MEQGGGYPGGWDSDHTRDEIRKKESLSAFVCHRPPGGMRKRKLISNRLFRVTKNQRAGIKKRLKTGERSLPLLSRLYAFSFPLLRTRYQHLIFP